MILAGAASTHAPRRSRRLNPPVLGQTPVPGLSSDLATAVEEGPLATQLFIKSNPDVIKKEIEKLIYELEPKEAPLVAEIRDAVGEALLQQSGQLWILADLRVLQYRAAGGSDLDPPTIILVCLHHHFRCTHTGSLVKLNDFWRHGVRYSGFHAMSLARVDRNNRRWDLGNVEPRLAGLNGGFYQSKEDFLASLSSFQQTVTEVEKIEDNAYGLNDEEHKALQRALEVDLKAQLGITPVDAANCMPVEKAHQIIVRARGKAAAAEAAAVAAAATAASTVASATAPSAAAPSGTAPSWTAPSVARPSTSALAAPGAPAGGPRPASAPASAASKAGGGKAPTAASKGGGKGKTQQQASLTSFFGASKKK